MYATYSIFSRCGYKKTLPSLQSLIYCAVGVKPTTNCYKTIKTRAFRPLLGDDPGDDPRFDQGVSHNGRIPRDLTKLSVIPKLNLCSFAYNVNSEFQF